MEGCFNLILCSIVSFFSFFCTLISISSGGSFYGQFMHTPRMCLGFGSVYFRSLATYLGVPALVEGVSSSGVPALVDAPSSGVPALSLCVRSFGGVHFIYVASLNELTFPISEPGCRFPRYSLGSYCGYSLFANRELVIVGHRYYIWVIKGTGPEGVFDLCTLVNTSSGGSFYGQIMYIYHMSTGLRSIYLRPLVGVPVIEEVPSSFECPVLSPCIRSFGGANFIYVASLNELMLPSSVPAPGYAYTTFPRYSLGSYRGYSLSAKPELVSSPNKPHFWSIMATGPEGAFILCTLVNTSSGGSFYGQIMYQHYTETGLSSIYLRPLEGASVLEEVSSSSSECLVLSPCIRSFGGGVRFIYIASLNDLTFPISELGRRFPRYFLGSYRGYSLFAVSELVVVGRRHRIWALKGTGPEGVFDLCTLVNTSSGGSFYGQIMYKHHRSTGLSSIYFRPLVDVPVLVEGAFSSECPVLPPCIRSFGGVNFIYVASLNELMLPSSEPVLHYDYSTFPRYSLGSYRGYSLFAESELVFVSCKQNLWSIMATGPEGVFILCTLVNTTSGDSFYGQIMYQHYTETGLSSIYLRPLSTS